MKIGICPLQLRDIGLLQCESISMFIFKDIIPLKGLEGFIDWRLGGMISKFLINGVISAEEGKNFLYPPRPKLRARKLFGFGMGESKKYNPDKIEQSLTDIFHVLGRADVHSTALMLPLRSENLYSFEEGLKLLQRLLQKNFDFDELIIVDRFEDPEKDLKKVTSALLI